MKLFFLCLKASAHVLKIRFNFFLLSFDQIIDELKNQKKSSNIETDIDIKKISNVIIKLNKIIPNNTCFKESIAIYSFMKSYEDSFEFIIGVRKDSNQKFHSHSWVEYHKSSIGKSKNSNFKEILRIK